MRTGFDSASAVAVTLTARMLEPAVTAIYSCAHTCFARAARAGFPGKA